MSAGRSLQPVAACGGCFRLFALLLLLLPALGCGGGEPRVLVLGIDGIDPRTIDLLMAEGKMPNFARLRQEGAYGHLRSFPPLLSPIVWTTIATGKTPDQHGIGHFVAVDPESGERLPVTSDMRRVKALWNIASESQRTVAMVGWWATWPPESVNGVLVSDRVGYHFLFEEGLQGAPMQHATYPSSLAETIQPLLHRPAGLGAEELAGFARVPEAVLSAELDYDDELSHLRWAIATAQSYRDIGLELWRSERPDLGMVYIEGVDSSSHLFGHLFRAQDLAGELAEQQEHFGGTVEAMYLLADRIVGDFLAVMDDRTTFVVLSDHGFDLGELHDDPSKTRDLRRVSERFHNEMGILYMFGRGVRRGARLQEATTLDVAPTVLALLDLPAAADMPGRVLEEAIRGAPPARVASYEGAGSGDAVAARRHATPGSEVVDQAILERLRSLGYLDDAAANGEARAMRSPQGERNLAAIHFREGRWAESVEIYRTLVRAAPDDAALAASLAGALGAMGDFEAAEAELRRAIELEPLNPEAYHNLAVIAERRGRSEEAIELYRRAARYAPSYEPPRQALLRLTGSPEPRLPKDEAEVRAWDLAEEASRAARRADYVTALELLATAEEMSPRSVLVFQYRSNVAYLMGDLPLAVEALERALELESDNVLFARNLERLREQMQ